MYYLRQFLDALLYPLHALLTSPGKVATSARRLAVISLPARIAILAAVFLIFAAIAGYFAFLRTEQSGDYMLSTGQTSFVLSMVFVIPLVLYYVLRLWLEGDVSRYPDIDYAWKAGLAELRAHGLELEYTPLFLVLGSAGESLEKTLFDAAQLPFRVREVPTGAAALHWYAEPNGIYLTCTAVGCLSKLADVAKHVVEDAKVQGGKTANTKRPTDLRQTIVPGGEEEPEVEPSPSVVASRVFPDRGGSSRPPITGTYIVSREQADDAVFTPAEPKQAALSQEVQREQELRLEYLCRLISKARQPLAGINGVLTLLPYSIVQTGRREGVELQRAVRRDTNAIVRILKMRSPVVALVAGLEEESGFREMVRRLGPEPAANQRYGKGFSVGNPPLPEQLEAVTTHACGSFERTVYQLFREKGALENKNNTKLYALLCKIRRTVRLPLTNVLAGGFGYDPEAKKEADAVPLFFSGCYFAATGDGESRQAFIKAVFEKLPAEQEELEWTEPALAEEDRYRRWSQTAMWLDAVLLLGLAVMIALAVFNRD